MAKQGREPAASSASKKAPVLERLFELCWDVRSATVVNPVVTLEQVAQAIEEHNETNPTAKLSPHNPANFFKDFIRRRDSANKHWPRSILERGYTAVQRTGGKRCFEFIPLTRDQTVPFPDRLPPRTDIPRFRVESLSLPLPSRRLGRRDETWLTQVLVRLRVIETHLALVSGRSILQLDHLQMGIKLRTSEVDALYLAVEQMEEPAILREILVSCEAKGKNDDILTEQIVAQVKDVFQMNVTQDVVLPIAAKVMGKSLIRVAEFDIVSRAEASNLASVSLVSDAIYELVPPVPGIGT